jgi:ABC-type Zn uptake system ZnuABC Zn-binding protein ZnuA
MTWKARHSVHAAAVAIATLAAVSACGGTSPAASSSTSQQGSIDVVATTTVLADLVAQVGGPRVTVHSLVRKGGEVHTFDPTPSDVQKITEARLIVRNGLGLDDWLTALIENAGTNAPVVTLGENLNGVAYLVGEGGPGSVNPHVWMNLAYASKYVDRIEVALAAADPANASEYRDRATSYKGTLAELDARIRDRIGSIPAADRVVVSFHDAFPYFAAAYGLTVVGTIVDAPGQDPSAGKIADLVAAIRANGVKAIFAEAQFSEALARTVAAETGATVVSNLYDDTLGDPPVDTYAGMMAWDADQVVKALGGG